MNHLLSLTRDQSYDLLQEKFLKIPRVEIKMLDLTQRGGGWSGCLASETFRLICLINRPCCGSYVEGPPPLNGSLQVSVRLSLLPELKGWKFVLQRKQTYR